MGNMMCPGQDTAFWRPGDIFEVPCSSCGREVEFFKDDATRRCPGCGKKVSNPKLNLGCAQWCEHAEKCLGYDPKKAVEAEGGETALVDKLIDAMRAEFGEDSKRISHALAVLEAAKDIMRGEGGASAGLNPRVILSAAVLHDIGIKEAERKHGSSAGRRQEREGPPIAERIMKDLGLDGETIDHVCRIVANHHSVNGMDTPEFKVIWDADWIVNIPDEYPGHGPEQIGELIDKVFKTGAGRQLAQARLLKSP